MYIQDVSFVASGGHGFVLRILKPWRKTNRAFTTLWSSKELVTHFVQLTRKSSLSWQKKHGNTTLHSQELAWDMLKHTYSKCINTID